MNCAFVFNLDYPIAAAAWENSENSMHTNIYYNNLLTHNF